MLEDWDYTEDELTDVLDTLVYHYEGGVLTEGDVEGLRHAVKAWGRLSAALHEARETAATLGMLALLVDDPSPVPANEWFASLAEDLEGILTGVHPNP